MREFIENAAPAAKLIPAAILAVWFVVINIVAVCITIRDKNIAIANGKLEEKSKSSSKNTSKGKKTGKAAPAKKNQKNNARPQRRVPEKTLLIIAALGGSAAMLITMRTIRHKTQHAKFMVGIPVIIIAQCLLAVALVLFL